jgi:hypothetical protein
MAITAQQFIDRLTENHRVVLIGGLAVIGHGYNRPTRDVDIWLERYSDWQVLRAALENPSPEVRTLAESHLREFAAAGAPFSQAILEGRPLP